jgi:hypothetical protein
MHSGAISNGAEVVLNWGIPLHVHWAALVDSHDGPIVVIFSNYCIHEHLKPFQSKYMLLAR